LHESSLGQRGNVSLIPYGIVAWIYQKKKMHPNIACTVLCGYAKWLAQQFLFKEAQAMLTLIIESPKYNQLTNRGKWNVYHTESEIFLARWECYQTSTYLTEAKKIRKESSEADAKRFRSIHMEQ